MNAFLFIITRWLKYYWFIGLLLVKSLPVFAVNSPGAGTMYTFAEKELKAILLEEQSALAALERSSSKGLAESEQNRILKRMVTKYRSYIQKNPEDVYGYILFGKYLMKVGEEDEALQCFLKANQKSPDIAVVKQQLGNLFAESGNAVIALACFNKAVELAPLEAVYFYQLGELLCHYKSVFLEKKIYASRESLEGEMLAAFRKARDLQPQSWDLKMRYGQAFYDVSKTDWEKALQYWSELEKVAPGQKDKEIVYWHKAHALIKLNRYDLAKQALNRIYHADLEKSRRELLLKIPKSNNISK